MMSPASPCTAKRQETYCIPLRSEGWGSIKAIQKEDRQTGTIIVVPFKYFLFLKKDLVCFTWAAGILTYLLDCATNSGAAFDVCSTDLQQQG